MIPKEDVVAVKPLVVVHGRPVKQSSHIDAAQAMALVHDAEALCQVVSPGVVVVGADPVLGDQDRRAG